MTTPIDPDTFRGLSDKELREFVDGLEALRLKRCRDNLIDFATTIEVPGTPIRNEEDGEYYPLKLELAAHHKLMLGAIQGLVDNTLGVTINGAFRPADGIWLFLPPGSAKSSFASVITPAWLLARRRNTNVIATSYGADLAQKFGRRVRTIVRSQTWREISGGEITGDNQAILDWSTTLDTTYRGTGILAGITGNRADYLLIDDPIKGREEADSEIIREKVWSAWQDDLTTRLKPGGKVIGVMTRWHADDLAGRLLGPKWKGQSGYWRGTDGRLWHVINLPMLAEHADDPLGRDAGEMLWPEWFRRADADRVRKTQPRTWSALYQQRPSDAEGNILLRKFWRCWPHGNPEPTPKQLEAPHSVEPPPVEMVLLSYDTAFEDGEDNDFSAMTAWGLFRGTSRTLDERDIEQVHAIMLGAWKAKVQAVDLIEVIEEHVKRFRILEPVRRETRHGGDGLPHAFGRILIENKASGIQLIQELRRRRWPVVAYAPSGRPGTRGKRSRALMAAYILEQGTTWYMPGDKTLEVIESCAGFPHLANDDDVDTVTQALDFLRSRAIQDLMSDAPTEDEEREAEIEAWRRQNQPRKLYGHMRAERPR